MILASTLILVRQQGNGVEVFLAKRTPKATFVPGALVFPGGKVDAHDKLYAFREHCDGAESLDDFSLQLKVASIREAFEEVGVLFLRNEGEKKLLSPDESSRLQSFRSHIESGELSFLSFVQQHKLRLACDCLSPYANWITPERLPRRYDTFFFLAEAPAGQVAEHDGSELVDSLWVAPLQAIQLCEEGKYTMIFPTRSVLRSLGKATSVEEAMELAKDRPIVPITPQIAFRDDGTPMLQIPQNVGYDVWEEELSTD
ncbi:MAG: NUDIX hydrolase [Deltaproteobacteria bacterium]|nr:MAG: NUDIX hydrolase [Deltaproteobacteria bacterium]